MKQIKYLTGFSILFLSATTCLAAHTTTSTNTPNKLNIIDARDATEEKVPPYFGITPHRPNYILPYYYTGSPYNSIYEGNTPDDEAINHNEIKYQISLKAPIWQNIAGYNSSLLFAYTQLSYFQVYNTKTFVRETDYEPEFFVANKIDYKIAGNWLFNDVNVGVNHQSNGFGNDLQRGWDRLYVEAVASSNSWMVSLEPWYVIDTNDNNSNISKYMGYGRGLVSYKYHQQVFSLEARNILEHAARYATAEVTWSFPLTKFFKGYVQIFSGYGQSLIEYNHRTNSGGVGVALSDWI